MTIVQWLLSCSMWTDGQTIYYLRRKVIVAFCNFVNVPKKKAKV